MQWVIDNWLTLVLVGGMLAMHLFGHGHGGHGGHGRPGQGRNRQPVETGESDADKNDDRAG